MIAYFIILATAATLFKAGRTDIKSAAEAAAAGVGLFAASISGGEEVAEANARFGGRRVEPDDD